MCHIVRFKDRATRKTKYYKTFQKKKDAQQSANGLRALIDNGQMKKVEKNRVKREIMTFEKVTDSLILVWRKKLERNKLSPDTFEGYICRANVLNNVFGKRIKVKDTKLVFCHLDGTALKRFDKAWRRICKLAGLDDFHYHDLRHTFCSNLILSGSDLKDVKEMIGHNDLAMTDRYSHLTNRHKQIRQDELDRYYRNGMCYNEVGYK